ncbi:MAG: hypothetical protein LKF41_06590 [Bifidobacterium sp.]|jgi:hypothetical protein|nr:hypothetical protein [Bifidobacterium sp.]MCH4175511.1 hypothetical protein [Bifidobacterium sp.]
MHSVPNLAAADLINIDVIDTNPINISVISTVGKRYLKRFPSRDINGDAAASITIA